MRLSFLLGNSFRYEICYLVNCFYIWGFWGFRRFSNLSCFSRLRFRVKISLNWSRSWKLFKFWFQSLWLFIDRFSFLTKTSMSYLHILVIQSCMMKTLWWKSRVNWLNIFICDQIHWLFISFHSCEFRQRKIWFKSFKHCDRCQWVRTESGLLS